MSGTEGSVAAEPAASPPGDPQPHAWDRWSSGWLVLFGIALGYPCLATLMDGSRPWTHRATTLSLAALLAVWHWVLVQRDPPIEDHPVRAVIYLAGVAVLFAVLLTRQPQFFFLVYALYPQCFYLLSVPAAVTATLALSAGTAVFAEGGMRELIADPGALIGIAGSTALAVTIGLFINAIAQQSAARADAIAQLEAARAQLALAADDNAVLLARTRRALATSESLSRTAGMLEERQRLAREIHDTLAQGFTSIVLQLEAAEQSFPGLPAEAAQHLDLARRTARESLSEVRRSVQALRPEPLEDSTLSQALSRVTAAWSAQTGIRAVASTSGSARPLHPEVEVTLLRTAQEALANTRKHADAGRVAVTLSYMEDRTTLDVRDDGTGFDPQAVSRPDDPLSGGFGLSALRQRLGRIGGGLAVETARGQGTALVATVPMPPPEVA